jgi:hypothetical protein
MQLTLPSASVLVLLDGVLYPYLEVLEIVRGDWPEFSLARLVYNPDGHIGDDLVAAEDVDAELSAGKSVCIQQVYNGVAPDVSVCSFPVFAGQIEAIETKIGPDGEKVEVVARDFSANLERVTIYGRWVSESDGSALFLSGTDTIFNDDGRPNAAIEPVEDNGNTLTLFSAEPTAGKPWSYAEVINYLFCRHVPNGQLQTPSIEQLRTLTEDQVVRDLDVTGLSLIGALCRCCERIGLRFKFVPRPVPTGPAQAIVFYRSGMGRAVELNCQPRREQFSISKTNVLSVHSRRNFWPVTHKYIGQGDFKVYEATFDLVKAWDPAGESTNYGDFSPSTNGDFYKVKNVYRKWCLNEAGGYSGAPYNQGDAFDFSKIFESSNFACRHRRFQPCLTTDNQGRSMGYFLQVSFDNGLYWRQYLYAFNILLDECGIWLSSDQLDFDTWVAALKGVLKFRIIASVVSDERLSCVVADGPVDSTAPVVEHVITLPRQFKYRKVSNRSIFANACDDALGVPDEIDDTTALFEFVRKRAEDTSEIVETADVRTPYLILDYQVGDRIGVSPESRDLLRCRSDNRSVACIERVQVDFEKQCTNLKIISKRSQLL